MCMHEFNESEIEAYVVNAKVRMDALNFTRELQAVVVYLNRQCKDTLVKLCVSST